VFCNIKILGKNAAGENLLVQLGWVEKFNPANSNAIIHIKNPALLLPFAPRPWWLPQANNPHEIMWATQPPAPSYPVYAILDAQNGQPLPGTDIIPVGERPELPDDHLQYAITWFALAGVLLALYIYRTWLQSSAKTRRPNNLKARFKDSF
jgi:cytochrome oxidase assembly protein ShyY1